MNLKSIQDAKRLLQARPLLGGCDDNRRLAYGVIEQIVAEVEAYPTPTIWCLLSIENNYDQPGNNLEAWWHSKPSAIQLLQYLFAQEVLKPDQSPEYLESTMLSILRGTAVRLGNTDYRLEEWKEAQ